MPYGKDPTTPPSDAGGYGKDPLTPPSEQGTTAGGLAGAFTRGLAPVAAGAGLGAMAGAPFAGVGAIPGAAAGAGAAGLTELATALYNPLAEKMGWPKTATPQEMTDKVLDTLGVKRASTGAERVAESVAGGAAGALGPARAAGELATAVSPVVSGVAKTMAEKPGLQTAAGALQGAGAQGSKEAGLPPIASDVVGMAAGTLPYGGQGLRAMIEADPRRAAFAAREAGYVLSPAAFSKNPGIVSNVLAGYGGKIKTSQDASAHNQSITNELAAEDLGLPRDTPLSPKEFEDVRAQAGKAYAAVSQTVPVTTTDNQYAAIIQGLGGANGQAAQLFPKITKVAAINDLIDELKAVPQMPTEAAMRIVRDLRYDGKVNLKSREDPSKHALGAAQHEAADALEDLIERNVAGQTGSTALVDAFKSARQLIAKSHDVEEATNPATGDVSAGKIAGLAAKGRPLSGNLAKIANAGMAFSKEMQAPAGFGYESSHSALDIIGSAAAALHGAPSIAGTLMGRPLARSGVLSETYQNTMAGKGAPPSFSTPFITQPGLTASDEANRKGLQAGETPR